MLTVPGATEVIAAALGVDLIGARQIARRLGEAGMLPRARGSRQAICTPQHAALLTIAIATGLGQHVGTVAQTSAFAGLLSSRQQRAVDVLADVLADPYPAMTASVVFTLAPFRAVRIAALATDITFGNPPSGWAIPREVRVCVGGVALFEISAALDVWGYGRQAAPAEATDVATLAQIAAHGPPCATSTR